jgi:hypothetical protein
MEAGVSYKQRRDKACYFRELLATDTDTDGGSGIYNAQETRCVPCRIILLWKQGLGFDGGRGCLRFSSLASSHLKGEPKLTVRGRRIVPTT